MTPFKVTSVKTDKSLLGIGVQYEAQYATIHNKFQTDLTQKKLQQQQHSLFSQASWGRQPKRN